MRHARQEFYNGHAAKADEILAGVKHVPKKDKLLFYMERGVVLHHLARYDESIEQLLAAAQLIKDQEVVSLSQQASSLVTSEGFIEYKGEYSERLWVHTYLTIDYLMTGKYEDALVEAKQALTLFDDHQESLADDYFTRALVALCYENLREWNDAFIEYKKLAKLLPDPQPVGKDLYRLSLKLGFADDAKIYRQYVADDKVKRFARSTEAVVFLGMGRGPVKVAADIVLPKAVRISFPRYVDRDNADIEVRVEDFNEQLPFSDLSTNMNKLARAALKERRLQVIAKETARILAKESISKSVGQKNGALAESLVRITFFMLGKADTRSWQTLPAVMALVRIPLKPGKHSLRLITRQSGAGGRKEFVLPDFTIDAGQRLYFSVRK